MLEALDGGRPSAGVTATVRRCSGTPRARSRSGHLGRAPARQAFAGAAAGRIDFALTPGAPSADDLEQALVRLHAEVEAQLRATGTPGPGGPGRGRGGDPDPDRAPRRDAGEKAGPGRGVPVQIANFNARIEAEHLLDDGHNDPQPELEMAGTLAGIRGALLAGRIHGNKFASMLWPITQWGSEAIVSAEGRGGSTAGPRSSSSAEQPPRRVAYVHAGWRQVPPYGWVFLHGGGAIGAQGALPDGAVSVELDGALAPLVLPPRRRGGTCAWWRACTTSWPCSTSSGSAVTGA